MLDLDKARLQDGELHLCLQNVLLRRLAHGIARFGNPDHLGEQIFALPQDLRRRIGMMQPVKGLRHARLHTRDCTARYCCSTRRRLPSARCRRGVCASCRRQFLRNHHPNVAGRLDAEPLAGEWSAVAGVPDRYRRIGHAALLDRGAAWLLHSAFRPPGFSGFLVLRFADKVLKLRAI